MTPIPAPGWWHRWMWGIGAFRPDPGPRKKNPMTTILALGWWYYWLWGTGAFRRDPGPHKKTRSEGLPSRHWVGDTHWLSGTDVVQSDPDSNKIDPKCFEEGIGLVTLRVRGLLKNKVACPSSGDFGAIFGGCLEDVWRNFGGNLQEIWRTLRGDWKEKT